MRPFLEIVTDVFAAKIVEVLLAEHQKMIDALCLEGPDEAFQDGIVVTAAGAAHRAVDAQHSEGLLIGVGRVLTAAIAVMQELAAARPAGLDRCAR